MGHGAAFGLGKQEDRMHKARKTTAQYLNGLGVAVLATIGGTFNGKNVSADFLVLAALLSLAALVYALWLARE